MPRTDNVPRQVTNVTVVFQLPSSKVLRAQVFYGTPKVGSMTPDNHLNTYQRTLKHNYKPGWTLMSVIHSKKTEILRYVKSVYPKAVITVKWL